ncbi:MAG: CPBP family glutamic-type intramembrane protease [Planctomycetota bacterium]|nr:CPBP family glutamic-type intramembrane protease [Planctomycetota bacterium]
MIALARLVFLGEIRRLVRDRRAVLMAVVFPMVAFPLIFVLSEEIGGIGKRAMAEKEVAVGADLRQLEPDVAARIRAYAADPELRIAFVELELDELVALDEAEAAERARELLGPRHHLLLVARPASEPGRPPQLFAWYDGSDELPDAADDRLRGFLERLRGEVRAERLVALTGADPADGLEPEPTDVARPEDEAGRGLGALLPVFVILILVSGGSFAALDAFAGEREAGTLETLLVLPVPAAAIAWGKFASVLLTGCVAVVGNGISLFLCLVFELGSFPSLPPGADWTTTAGRLAVGLASFFPTAILVCAILCYVGSRARSFREGQGYTLPVMLVMLALALPAMQPGEELGYLLAVVPITGSTMALRDAVAGVLRPGPALAMLAASAGWAWLALTRLAHTLDAERLLASRENVAEMQARRIQSRRALAWGSGAVILVYVVGGRLQAWNLTQGLLLTLWVLVPALAIFAARGTARRAGEPLWKTLGLRAPHPTHLLGALLLAPTLQAGATLLFELQQRVLPLPSRVFEQSDLVSFLGELTPLATFLLLALSPGLMEELLFRGAILSGLRRDLSPRRVVFWQALLFGAVHASIYRFLPTAILGGILAAITLRARSVWPAMALHVAYNGLLVLELGPLDDPRLAWLGLLGIVLLAVRRR